MTPCRTLVIVLSAALGVAVSPAAAVAQLAAPPQPARPGAPPVKAGSQTFNTVITKLKAGKQIFSNTIIGPDLEVAKKACDGVDFVWIEMQHSTLTWRESQQLINCLLYTSPSPRDRTRSRMPSSA